MKFATKLSLGCIALLSCALGAAGLLLTGQSFSGSLASTRTALQAQQEKEKYALERFIFQATDSAQFENYILASATQQYAEQTADAGSSMALWLDGAYALYSGLPAALPRTALKQALTDGENAWQLTRAPAVVSAADPAAGSARRAGRYALRLRCERGVRHP